MKKLLLLGVAFATLTVGSALAADLGRRPIYKAPPPAPPPLVYNWTGFYVGGYVGGAFPEQDVTATDLDGFNLAGHSWDYRLDNSFIGGGTLGYNWQFPGSPWLVGIEGEGGYMRLTGSAPDPLLATTVSSARMGDWYAVLAGRLGWLATPQWLLYAKGGAAWTDLNADVTDPLLVPTASGSKTTTGWAAGGGAEWMFAPQWSAKVEYLFLGFDDNVEACGGAAATQFCWNHDVHGVHTVKVGLNYHF